MAKLESKPRESWIRLDASYQHQDWLIDEEKVVRSAWVDLLLMVVMESGKTGCIRRRSTRVFSKLLEWPEAVVERMIKAAEAAGEITVDDETITVCSWDRFRNPENVRRRKTPEESAEEGGSDAFAGNIRQNVQSKTKTQKLPETSGKTCKRDGNSKTAGNIRHPLSKRERTPPSPTETPPQGVTKTSAPEPNEPWWSEHGDPVAVAFAEAILAVPKFASSPPTVGRVERLLAGIREFAPCDDAILGQIESWQAYNADLKQKRGGSTDAVAAFRNWVEKLRGSWSQAKRQLSASNGQAELAKALSAEEWDA